MFAVEVEGLVKDYGNIRALKGITFNIEEGEIFGLIGPNGAGKTTALRIIATLLSPTEGSVRVFGYDVRRDGEKIREIISYLPEEAGAYRNLTGLDYLKFMASLYAKNREEIDKFIERAMDIAGLGDRIRSKISTYSKGMVRKLLLSRALMIMPKLAILDEPTSGLDVINSIEIRKLIKDFTTRGVTVLLSSHNMLEIEFLSDRIALIDKGQILEIGKPDELKEKYGVRNIEEVFMEVVR